MNDVVLQQFIQLIATYTGLQIRPQDRDDFCQKILARMRAIKLTSAETYYQLLETNTQQSQSEWRELCLSLTTTETYFLRDRGQFFLLQNLILPELIESKKQLHKSLGTPPSLRLWSAGCSTGEEPYSLAILLQELIPDWEQWNLWILGTDINEEALEKAKGGIYSNWSFRLVDSQLQKRYFSQRKNGWKIDDRLRHLVTLRYGNLVQEEFSSFSDKNSQMDLIICRNVFVYFEAKYISLVLKKFYNALRPGGYLMTGHAELYGQIMGSFQTKIFPESVVYQRRNSEGLQTMPSLPNLGETTAFHRNSQEATTPLASVLPASVLGLSRLNPETAAIAPLLAAKSDEQTAPHIILQEAETLFRNKAYTEAIKKAEQVIQLYPHNFDAYCLLAQVHANTGKYEQAIQHCKRASEVDSLSVLPYYLLAHIAEEQGDLEGAKILLRRIIYLSPSSIWAYLRLGEIYEKENNLMRAKKMYKVAGDFLRKMPPSTILENQEKMTALELLNYVQKALDQLCLHSIQP